MSGRLAACRGKEGRRTKRTEERMKKLMHDGMNE